MYLSVRCCTTGSSWVDCVTERGITGDWRKLHSEELYDFYCSADIIRVIRCWRMRWVGHVAGVGERKGAYRIIVGRSEGNGPIGEVRRR